MAEKRQRRPFGKVRQLPSDRWQASYIGPDGTRHAAPATFSTKAAASAWLSQRQSEILREVWTPTPSRGTQRLTFASYADAWLLGRSAPSQRKPLAPRTTAHYRDLLDRFLLPTFGDLPLRSITEDHVSEWFSTTALDRPTTRAHAYTLLASILRSAATRTPGKTALIPFNPAAIRGGGTSDSGKRADPASLDEIAMIVDAMPDRYRAMILLAAWAGLRFGELTELRRRDVNTKTGQLKVARAVVRVDGTTLVGKPKSDAGLRTVAVPPHILPAIREHLLQHTGPGPDGLLFPAAHGGHMAPSTLYKSFYRARDAAGRPDLRFHDLRHTAATMTAQTGASLAELMGRLGHSTPSAAMVYQHAARGRDVEIAAAMSLLAERPHG